MSRRASRGPYAKGVARRREIIDAALEVLSTQGLRNSTLDEIALKVGITRQGVLHYFGSREQLLVSVLEARDAYDLEAAMAERQAGTSPVESLLHAVARTRRAPGLARLYTQLTAEAIEPSHPAHEYFRRRYDRMREVAATQAAAGVAAGTFDESIDPAVVGQLLQALLDGLQLQWLLDPDMDPTKALEAVTAVLLPAPLAHPTSGGEPTA